MNLTGNIGAFDARDELVVCQEVLEDFGFSKEQIQEITAQTSLDIKSKEGRPTTLTYQGRREYNNRKNFQIGAGFVGVMAASMIFISNLKEVPAIILSSYAGIALAVYGITDDERRKTTRKQDLKLLLAKAGEAKHEQIEASSQDSLDPKN
ncbi:MAG: hypothetical protein WCK98_04790 [bacterium]